MTPLEILLRARQRIEAGWVKRTSRTTQQDESGNTQVCYCLQGAVVLPDRKLFETERLLLEEGWDVSSVREALRYVSDVVPGSFQGMVTAYNDHSTTTQAMVLSCLDQAITRARENETRG